MDNQEKIRKPKALINALTNDSELHKKIYQKLAQRRKYCPVNRCLFGKADPDYSKRLLREEYKNGGQRFLKIYNFDIENVTFVERNRDPEQENIENDLNQQNIDINNYEDRRAPKKSKINFLHSIGSKQRNVKNYYKIKKRLFADEKKPLEKQQQQQQNQEQPLNLQNSNQI